MTVRIEIFADNAAMALADLADLASAMNVGKMTVQLPVQTAEAYFEEQTSEVEDTGSETAPAPKRRGRPAKAKVDTGTTEPSTDVTAPPESPVEATATSQTVTEAEVVQTDTSADDDEFAAFANAAKEVETAAEEMKASIPARKWTDADLGSLCNQAAVKMGDPAPVKALIAEFVDADTVPHSRNIPAEKRADFAAAVEAKAGIEFAG